MKKTTEIIPIRPFPALLLQRGSERVLIVTDLHLGWEATLAQKGIHIPSQMPKILAKLIQLIKNHNPTTLIFLGDIKHTVATAETMERRDIPIFFETVGEIMNDIRIIPGNHDGNLIPLIPKGVNIYPSNGMVLFMDIGLFHGHSWPAPELLGCRVLIIGHVHPIVAFRDPLGFRVTRQVWVKTQCDGKEVARSLFKYLNVKDDREPTDLLRSRFNVPLMTSQLFIMPSFNELLGGLPMNKHTKRTSGTKTFIGPIFRSKGVDVDNTELFLLDGTFLGSITQLRKLT